MRRLAAVSLALATIFVLLTGVSLLIGRAQPPPERVERLHLTDCDPPCWNGITSRVSSRGELEQRIAFTFPDYRALRSANLPFLTWVKAPLTIDVAVDDGTVHTVGIESQIPMDEMPRLGDVLALFGSPTCIVVYERATSATLYYENAAHEVVFGYSIYQKSLRSLVNGITIGVSHNLTCQMHIGITWQAFRRSQRSFASTS